MTARRRYWALFVLFSSFSACASYNYAPRIEPVGRYRNTTVESKRADQMRWKDAEDVEVIIGQFPEGIRLENNQLIVDTSRFTLLGHVTAQPKESWVNFLGFWPYDYPEDQSWRKTYCAIQTPLSWLTLGIWSVVSPIYAPCHIGDESSDGAQDRMNRIVHTLQKATKAAGGNLLVITSFGKDQEIREWAQSSFAYGSYPWGWGGGRGCYPSGYRGGLRNYYCRPTIGYGVFGAPLYSQTFLHTVEITSGQGYAFRLKPGATIVLPTSQPASQPSSQPSR